MWLSAKYNGDHELIYCQINKECKSLSLLKPNDFISRILGFLVSPVMTLYCSLWIWRIALCLNKTNVHTLIWKYYIAKWCQNNYNSNIKDHWPKDSLTNNNNEKSLNILRITKMWPRHIEWADALGKMVLTALHSSELPQTSSCCVKNKTSTKAKEGGRPGDSSPCLFTVSVTHNQPLSDNIEREVPEISSP